MTRKSTSQIFTFKAVLMMAMMVGFAMAHYRNATSPYPEVDLARDNCYECLAGGSNYTWCPFTSECFYFYVTKIVGHDCTAPQTYQDLITTSIPKNKQFTQEFFDACLTDYTDVEEPKTKVSTDCAFIIDPETGLREMVTGRIIVEDFEKKDTLPDGVKKHFVVQPEQMCQVMLANTLSTSYKYFYDWKNQDYVYWAVYEFAQSRNDNLTMWWDQMKELRRDALDEYYIANTSFDYILNYDHAPATNATMGFYNFTSYEVEKVQKLWPKESVYFYVYNNGDTAQEFMIAYSAAALPLTGKVAAVTGASLMLALLLS